MTRQEREFLKMLGYKTSNEEGAIMEHPKMNIIDKYVWEGQKFRDILKAHNKRLHDGIAIRMAQKVLEQEYESK